MKFPKPPFATGKAIFWIFRNEVNPSVESGKSEGSVFAASIARNIVLTLSIQTDLCQRSGKNLSEKKKAEANVMHILEK